MLEGHWKVPGDPPDRFAKFDMEFDVEYTNGWRETILIRAGEEFVMPFEGAIVAMRSI